MVVEGPAKLLHKKRAKADKVYLILFNDSIAVTNKKENPKKAQHTQDFRLYVHNLVDLTRLAAYNASDKVLSDKEEEKEYCHSLTLIFNTTDIGPQESRHEYRFFFKNPTDEWARHLENVLGTTFFHNFSYFVLMSLPSA